MILKIYPYKMSSQSSKNLARALNATRVYPDRNYRTKQDHMIVNWGNSTLPSWYDGENQPLNHPNDVIKATNKLLTFQAFNRNQVPCPDWTTNIEDAQNWIDQGHLVYGRKTLTGHSGQGIILFQQETVTSELECPLYTKSTKAKYEYRIHIGDGGETAIDMVQKRKRNGIENISNQIRSYNNGWIFAREECNPPTKVIEAAKAAVKAIGLDFGAVDVGFNVREDKAYVYEVNTAPGLQGTTLTSYVEYFQRKANEPG